MTLPFLIDTGALQPDETPGAAVAQLRQQGCCRLGAEALAALAGQPLAALEALRPHWDALPPDEHLKDGGRYRRRRHGSYIQMLGSPAGGSVDAAADHLAAVPHRAHWQPTTYNALHGGMLRWFAPLEPALAEAPAFRALVARLGQVFAAVAAPGAAGSDATPPRWYIEAHPFRIDTTGGLGRPTPEGAHRDGVSFVAVLLVDRVRIIGGETRVFAADGPQGVRFTLTERWSALLLDDRRVIHESTPIQPDPASPPEDAERGAWRDTLVLTYRSGGFQDPPPVV